MFATPLASRSLRFAAWHAQQQLRVGSRWKRRARWCLVRIRDLARDEFSIVIVVALAAVVFLPTHWHFRSFAGHPDRAGSFLQALWVVEGGTLAITLAVVIFVFEAISKTATSSLRQFAEEVGLYLVFYIGAVGVVLDGIVLLGGGQGAPNGWAATWATCWGGIDACALISLFIAVVRSLEPGALRGRRLHRARGEIEQETQRLIHRRIALTILSRLCAEQYVIDFTPVFALPPSATAITVFAGRAGQVTDIRLRRLRRLGHAAHELGLPQPRLRAQLGVAVAETTELLWAEPPALERVRRARRIFVFGRRVPQQAFRTTLRRLRHEAMVAISDPISGDYRDVMDVYEELLLVPPRVWAQYGADFGPESPAEHRHSSSRSTTTSPKTSMPKCEPRSPARTSTSLLRRSSSHSVSPAAPST